MSLVNIRIVDDCAYIAVDTAMCAIPSNDSFEGTKLLVLPGPNVVLAARGDVAFAKRIFLQYLLRSETQDYDSIAKGLKSTVRKEMDLYDNFQRSHGNTDPQTGSAEIYLVGWSKRAGKPAACQVKRAGGSVEKEDLESSITAPGISANLGGARVNGYEGLMMLFAQHQVAEFKSTGLPLGGRLIFAKLTKDEISIRDLGEI